MKRLILLSALSLLLAAALVLLGCGGSRQLQSVAISPGTADAHSFANGQVPFTATGMFSKPPSPSQLTSADVTWCVGGPSSEVNPTAGVCPGNIDTGATVDQNGVAQCLSGFTGTTSILAGTVSSPALNPDGMTQLKVFGSAQLTCP